MFGNILEGVGLGDTSLGKTAKQRQKEQPIMGSLYDNSTEQTMDMLRQNYDLYNRISTPTAKWKEFKPEDFSFDTISEDPAIRAAQMKHLEKLSGLADSGLSEMDELAFLEARQGGEQMAKAGTGAAIEDANRRGVGGSGLEYAMRMGGEQAGVQNAQMMGMQKAAEAARQRQLYNATYGSQLGNQRSQDFTANSANTDIINRFNTANTQNRNDAQQYNLEGSRAARQQRFNNEMARAGGMAGANSTIADAFAAQGAANDEKRKAKGGAAGGIIGGIYGGPQGAQAGSAAGGAVA